MQIETGSEPDPHEKSRDRVTVLRIIIIFVVLLNSDEDNNIQHYRIVKIPTQIYENFFFKKRSLCLIWAEGGRGSVAHYY